MEAWSIADFEEKRPHLKKFLDIKVVPLVESRETRTILILAPVKSGKRQMEQYLAIRDRKRGYASEARVHVHISAFHRVSDEGQRDEHVLHNIKVFSGRKISDAEAFIDKALADFKVVVIHFDEGASYGTGEKQRMSPVYRKYRNNVKVTSIMYDATPLEMILSAAIDQSDDSDAYMRGEFAKGVHVNYTPPPGYCGAKNQIENGLLHEATPFFEAVPVGGAGAGAPSYALTEQGREIIAVAQDFHDAAEAEYDSLKRVARRADATPEQVMACDLARRRYRKNIIILRLSYNCEKIGARGNAKEGKALRVFLKHLHTLPELRRVAVRVDKHEEKDLIPHGTAALVQTIDWSNKKYWDGIQCDTLEIILMDATSTRSTEWVFHDRILAVHDYRKSIVYSVVAQAQLRVAHYKQAYGGEFQGFPVYGHVKTWMLAAGLIDHEEYVVNPWRPLKVRGADLYMIKDIDGGPHPDYNGRYSSDEAGGILRSLDSDRKLRLSDRVSGGVRRVPIVKSEFYACTPASVGAVIDTIEADLKNREKTVLVGLAEGKVRDHKFLRTGYFDNRNAEGQYEGNYDGITKVLTRDYLTGKTGGITEKSQSVRLQVCYDNGVLGLFLRYWTGEHGEDVTLAATKSMFKA